MKRRLLSAGLVALLVVLWMPASALGALPYDGTNPGATACGDGSNTVYTLATASILSATGTKIGTVELRHSAVCATVWSRVTNLTTAAIDVREKLITYSSPNGTGATTYTETDTLSAKGGATDSGWSKQYRDRPGFLARGEMFYGGAWRTAQTVRGVMYAQFDGNYPNDPWTCDDTAGDYCNRYRTVSGGPITLQYGFDPSLSQLPASPNANIATVMGSYEALSGASPNLDATTPDNADILFWAYDGSNETGVYARSISFFTAGIFPQYYNNGWTKFNIHGPTVTGGDYRALVCHEFGHVLGMMDMVFSGHAATKATCVGATHTAPQIDDQQSLTKMYSTALASS